MVDQTYPRLQNPYDIQETYQLSESAGAKVVDVIHASRNQPHPATFIGGGKVDEIKDSIKNHDANVVVVNHPITPIQERNLERALECRVLDRTRLILDIFAQRAQSHEGKLQVELAQLKHLSTRLVRGWTHLERQKGGIGMRGPGETQLETDRRLISFRIKTLTKRLQSVEKQRNLRRRARDRVPVPVITLVGYTNAGKSTLFNRLVGETIYAADQLFATLDPTMRRHSIKNFGDIVLSDTVGFIQELPHSLVAAFHSTLEEVKNSAILLHVIDYSNDEHLAHISEVDSVLDEIDANHIPIIKVFNKIDLTEKPSALHEKQSEDGSAQISVYLSAEKQIGFEKLNEAIYSLLTQDHKHYCVKLSVTEEKIRSLIHQKFQVENEIFGNEGGATLSLFLSKKEHGWLKKQGVRITLK